MANIHSLNAVKKIVSFLPFACAGFKVINKVLDNSKVINYTTYNLNVDPNYYFGIKNKLYNMDLLIGEKIKQIIFGTRSQ